MAGASSLGSLTLNMIADIGGYTAPMEQAERVTKKAMKAMGMAVDEFGQYTDKNIKKAVDSVRQLDSQFEKLTEGMNREIALYGDTTRAMQMRYDLEKGALKSLTAEQKTSLTDMTRRLEAMDNASATFRKAAAAAQSLDRQFEEMTANMNREIALYGDTTRAMQLRYDLEKGALKSLSAEQKATLSAMANRLDAMDNANSSFRSGSTKTQDSMRNLRGQAQNVGWQMQDVAVQLQAGTDKLVIFSQQGSQLASGFGPTGALVGAFIAVGGAIAGVLMKSLMAGSEAMKEMASRAEALAKELNLLSDAQQRIVRQALAYSEADKREEIDATTKAIEAQRQKIVELEAAQGTTTTERIFVGGQLTDATRSVTVDNTEKLVAATKALNALETQRITQAKELRAIQDPARGDAIITGLARELELIGLTGKALYEKEAAQKGLVEAQALEYVSFKMLIDLRKEELALDKKAPKDKRDSRAEGIEKLISGMEREAELYGITSRAAQVEYDIVNGLIDVKGGLAGVEGQRLMIAAKHLDVINQEGDNKKYIEDVTKALEDQVAELEMGTRKWIEFNLRARGADDDAVAHVLSLRDRLQELTAEQEKTAKDVGDVYAAMWERLGAQSTKVLTQLMDGNLDIFDGILDAFKQLLAEMANETLIKPVMLNIRQSFQDAEGGTSTKGGGEGGASSLLSGVGVGGIYAAAAIAVVAAVSVWNKQQDEKFAKMTSEYRQGTQATGTILGSLDEKSQSLNNAIANLEKTSSDALSVNNAQLRALQDIRVGLVGVSQGFARTGFGSSASLSNMDFGTIAVNESQRAKVNSLATDSLLYGTGALDLGGIFSDLYDFGDGFLNSVFNKVSKEVLKQSVKMTDSGIEILGGSLMDIINGGLLEVQAYADITKEKKFLGVSTGKKMDTLTQDLDAQVVEQLSGVFRNAGAALEDAAGTLGADFASAASKMLIDASHLSLKDLKGDELAAEIESFFSATLDNWAKTLVGGTSTLLRFQKVGEGAFETIIRLASETRIVTQALDFVGQTLGELGVNSVEGAQRLAGYSGGFDALTSNLAAYYDKFFDDSEKFANFTQQLTTALEGTLDTLPTTIQGFRGIVDALDLTNDADSKMFATLVGLSPAIYEYIKGLEEMSAGTGAAAKAAKSLADFMRPFQTQVDTAFFSDFEKGLYDLDYALKTALASANALGATEAELAIIREASALDMLKLQQTQTDKMLAALKASVDKEKALEEEAYAASVDRLREDFDAKVVALDSWLETQLAHYARRSKVLSDSIQVLGQLSGALESVMSTLKQDSAEIRSAQWFGATAELSSMAGDFTAGRGLPDASAVEALADKLGGGQDFFSTFEDYAFASGTALNDAKILKDATDAQLSIDEKMLAAVERGEQAAKDNHARMMERLKAEHDERLSELETQHRSTMDLLDKAFEKAQEQVNAIRDVNTSVATVADAVSAMQEAIAAELSALRAADQLRYEEMQDALDAIALSTARSLIIAQTLEEAA